MIKKIVIGLAAIIVFVATTGFWAYGLIDKSSRGKGLKLTEKSDIPYIADGVKQTRGKILAVVTSHDKLGETGEETGYELTELSRAYYVFEANGFEVDVASPKGGKPPVVIDDGLGAFDYAFLNDAEAQGKVDNSIPLSDVDAADYQAVYFVGGKGTMFDFPDNSDVIRLVEHFYHQQKPIAAVCHGPVALLNAKNAEGQSILHNKGITSFTNEEELLLIPDAETVFPFLLESQLTQQGAKFNAGGLYLDNMVVDGNIITGQNPWSVWSLADATITQLGYQPIRREITGEEHAVMILVHYRNGDKDAALDYAQQLLNAKQPMQRNLIFMHGVLEFMQFNVIEGVKMLWFVGQIKGLEA